jgi:Cu-processing system ATP-binding protein
MIEIQQLNKRFGSLQALSNVSARFGEGQCIALIGPNGCGKTTLIKSVLGMVIPSSGKILFQGKDIAGDFEYRKHIGYMPQIGRYPDNMKIGQILDMIRSIRQAANDIDEDLLRAFGLEHLFHKRMRTLSGGTTQKVSATLAFLFNPRVLILDEPTAGLDPLSAELLKEKIIAEKKKGKLILVTSHILSELDDLVTQIIFMQEGSIRFHRDISDLRRETGEERISKAIASILKKSSA